jgi:hypothetical protein
LLSGETSTRSNPSSSATIIAFFNSKIPTCTPSGAITNNSLDLMSSFTLSSGITFSSQ